MHGRNAWMPEQVRHGVNLGAAGFAGTAAELFIPSCSGFVPFFETEPEI
jgi:hypothetical protein